MTCDGLCVVISVPPQDAVGMFNVAQLYPNIFMLFWTNVNDAKVCSCHSLCLSLIHYVCHYLCRCYYIITLAFCHIQSYNIYHGDGQLLVSTVAMSYIIDIRLVDISQSFYVRPVNMAGEGPSSDHINLQAILSSNPILDSPQLLTAVNIQPMRMLLSWFPLMHPPHDIVSQ